MSACLKLDQQFEPGFTPVPNELYRRLDELPTMAKLLILFLARYTYGWHRLEAHVPVDKLRQKMGCCPRTFRQAREQAVAAGFLEWGKEHIEGRCRTWWKVRVPPACQAARVPNVPQPECQKAPCHVSKEKDQRKHHQHEPARAVDDASWSDQTMDREETPAERPFPPEKTVAADQAQESEFLKVPPAAHLVEELREWGVNRRMACRIVATQPEEKLKRALELIRERPHVRNPAGWLVAECSAEEPYAPPGSVRLRLVEQRTSQLKAARRAEEQARKAEEEAENERHLEMVEQLVEQLGAEERAGLEELARQRARRLTPRAGSDAQCPIFLAEFRNLVHERCRPRPSARGDAPRWSGLRTTASGPGLKVDRAGV